MVKALGGGAFGWMVMSAPNDADTRLMETTGPYLRLRFWEYIEIELSVTR